MHDDPWEPTLHRILRALLSASAALCLLTSMPTAHAAPERIHAFNPHKMKFKAGAYRCESGKRLNVRSVSSDMQTAVLQWDQRDYTVKAVGAPSGALRYEDAASGLVWLMIPAKGMLLDASQGQRLADGCRA
jgi:membrane-bound inhibitor of C-type lysozyme